MTEAVVPNQAVNGSRSSQALKRAATFWFLVAAIGHWIFVAYVVLYFGPRLLRAGAAGLEGTHLPNGFIPGDTVGNLAMVAHLILAVIVIGGGPLQLVPQIRAHYPRFHHWLGRSYLLAAVVSATAGLYMVWTREPIGGLTGKISISLDGVLIIVFAAIALRHAIARNIRVHRRWALRLFMVASSVWFFRIGLMGWAMATGGAGIDFETFTGPFIAFWNFGQYLVPLAVLQLYFHAQDHGSPAGQATMAGGLVLVTLAMGFGIFAATMGMWLPKL